MRTLRREVDGVTPDVDAIRVLIDAHVVCREVDRISTDSIELWATRKDAPMS